MNLDSFASVVIWLVIVLIVLGIQPWKTFAAMGRAVEHNEDRYSTSMRIINVDDLGYMVACDDGRKGIAMLSGAGTSILDDVYVARVRAQRKEAIRRRRILVLSLLVLTVLILVLAVVLHFSAWLALIPATLEAVVLYLGTRAAKAQRAWEARVADSRRQWREQAARKSAHITSAVTATAVADSDPSVTELATESLSQEDIAQTIARAQEERRSVMRARAAMAAAERAQRGDMRANDGADEVDRIEDHISAVPASSAYAPTSAALPAASVVDMDAAIADHHVMHIEKSVNERYQEYTEERTEGQMHTGRSVVDIAGAVADVEQLPDNQLSGDQKVITSNMNIRSNADGYDQTASSSAQSQEAQEFSDATHELAQIRPAHALDAFEMAVSQDLISFSLGAPRNVEPVRTEEPQSLPIISTKQVSQAVPDRMQHNQTHQVEQPTADPSMDEVHHAASATVANHSADEDTGNAGNIDNAGNAGRVNNANNTDTAGNASGDGSANVDVEVPEASTESLGANVDAVLARRRG